MISSIQLNHGSGAGLDQLLREVIHPCLSSDQAGPFEDAAVIKVGEGRIAFTTDSFVVQPLEFPGGDIGKLSACGTINDLAMMGAIPSHLSVALVIEDGFDAGRLRGILGSLRAVCTEAGISICCGDTKVVDKGKADGLFITTSGLGRIPPRRNLSVGKSRPGDAVIVSGPIGLHGIAVLAARKGLGFASSAISDCAPLSSLAQALLEAVPRTRTLRDATRGGVSAVVNEIAEASGVTIRIRRKDVPVPDVVAGACSYLGMDPLHIANEGRFVAVVPGEYADRAVEALAAHEMGRGAAPIGVVERRGRFPAIIETEIGATRTLDLPPGELLPRIC